MVRDLRFINHDLNWSTFCLLHRNSYCITHVIVGLLNLGKRTDLAAKVIIIIMVIARKLLMVRGHPVLSAHLKGLCSGCLSPFSRVIAILDLTFYNKVIVRLAVHHLNRGVAAYVDRQFIRPLRGNRSAVSCLCKPSDRIDHRSDIVRDALCGLTFLHIGPKRPQERIHGCSAVRINGWSPCERNHHILWLNHIVNIVLGISIFMLRIIVRDL